MVANPSTNFPPLENGDCKASRRHRLTRIEFERRYAAMPNLKKAELVEGVVYVPAALRFRNHAEPHSRIMTWLGVYQVFTLQVAIGDNPTIRLDLDNAPQPDAVLMINGGRLELVVEVAASSAAYELHDKKRAYRRNGVPEYLVWRVYEGQFDWFIPEAGKYIKQQAGANGILRSQIFPGLWLAVDSLLSGEMQQVLKILQQGLDSKAHQDFISD
ncbi:MAG: Uma2 family endonuclease [Cyanobacteria bacterium J06621_8]